MRILYLLLITAVPMGLFAQDSTWLVNVTDQVELGDDSLYNFRIYATDVNNDDYPDLLLQYGNWGQNQLRLFLNLEAFGNRVFADITSVSGINPPGRIADVAVVADFNNDGNVDIVTNAWYHTYLTDSSGCYENPDTAQKNGSGLRIFLGDGTGKFTMKENSGLEMVPPNSGSALPVLDYDRDGNLDLYVGSWYTGWCDPAAPSGGVIPDQKHLLKGMGDGTFVDETGHTGIEGETNYGIFGANVADFNNDCYPDILNTPYDVQGTGNVFKNMGNGTFQDVATDVGFDLHYAQGNNGKQPMVPWEAMPYDFDSDGDIDFLVPFVHGGTASTSGKTCIYVNGGQASGWTLTPEPSRIIRKNPQSFGGHYGDHKAVWWDMDNDGLVDLVISDGGYGTFSTTAERLHFCKQDTSHIFTDITKELGFIDGTSAKSIDTIIKGPHAIEPIDYDLDGDDDLAVGMLYNPIHPFLFLRNDIGNKNNWLKIKLEAPPGVNRNAIGTRIYVTAGGLTQMRDVDAGEGHFGGQQPLMMTFGLGRSSAISTVIVRWPDKTCSETILTDVPVNKTIVVNKEGFRVLSAVENAKPQTPQLQVYPNPLGGNMLTVKSNAVLNGIVEIHSLLGQHIAVLDYTNNRSNELQIPIGMIANGIYVFQLKQTTGQPISSFFAVAK